MREFRVKITDEEYNEIQKIKQRFGLVQNKQVLQKLLFLAKGVEPETVIADAMRAHTLQLRNIQLQIGILNEMQSEYLDGEGMRAVGYGTEAPIYESAEKLYHEHTDVNPSGYGDYEEE